MERRRLHIATRTLHTGCNALLALIATTALCRADTPPAPGAGDLAGHDYPTSARVEYVQECVMRNGGELSYLYKCSCAIDRIADELSYDDFVEWGTFARNASLAGERGGVFRDSDQARESAKQYRAIEAEAHKTCGLPVLK
jgi:hypothetical protein